MVDTYMITTAIGAIGTVAGLGYFARARTKFAELAGELISTKVDLKKASDGRSTAEYDLNRANIALNASHARVDVLERENLHLAEGILKAKEERDAANAIIARRRAIAKAASIKGHIVQSAKAAERREAKRKATEAAAAGEPWPTRDEVVAPVRERRQAKKSGGVVASSTGG